ncbi:MAG: glycosyltransferase [Phycisphaerales bacterium]
MLLPLDIPLMLFSLGAGASAAYWGILLGHVVRTRRALPTARDGVTLAEARTGPAPRVLVIIPAHNEARVIGGLVQSLTAQSYPAFSVVFALDRCTDATREIIAAEGRDDPRITVHDVRPCPEGWAGKVNAVWSAVEGTPEARAADLLLFADADTQFHEGCIGATVALLETRGVHLLSLLSTLTTRTWFEKLIQPVAAMELLRQAPPLRANRSSRARPFANGQFMLFRRESYFAIGGHEAVRAELLEDIHLARKMSWSGRPTGLLMADGMLTCRMYESIETFERGWKRIYTEVANRRPRRLRRAARMKLLTGVVLPAGSWLALLGGGMGLATGTAGFAAALIALGLGAVGLALMLLALLVVFGLGGSWKPGVLAYPFGAWRVASILRGAAADLEGGRATVWAGKSYDRPVR